MSFERYIEDTLCDCIEDRITQNQDRSAVDHMELSLMDGLSRNRYKNDMLWKVTDMIVDNYDLIEEVTSRTAGRDVHRQIDEVLDVIVAYQIHDSGRLDELSDRDYYWVRDLLESDLHSVIYGESRGRRSRGDRSGHNYSTRDDRGYDRGRRTRGPESSPYGGGRYSGDHQSGNHRESHGYSTPRDVARGSRQVVNSRVVRENDGLSRLASMRSRTQPDTPQEAPQAPQRPSRTYSGMPHQDVEENVSYEPVDAPRTSNRVVQEDDVIRRQQEAFRQRVQEPTSNPKSESTRRLVFDKIPPASQQGYDHTTAHPYEEFWEDDCLWQSSITTKWKLTGKGADGMVQLYNIYKYVSYHVMDKFGNVTQRFKPVTEDNRYINHTLLKDPDNFGRSFQRKIPNVNDILGRNDTSEDVSTPVVEEQGMELEDVIDITQTDLDSLSKIAVSENLATSTIEARNRLASLDGKTSSVSSFMLLDPIEAGSVAEADLIRDLYSHTTLVALSKGLRDIEGKVSRYNYDRLNKKIGDAVIAEMQNAFGIDIRKMNFANQWENAINHISTKYGGGSSDWLDMFSRRMNAMIPTFLGVINIVDDRGNIADGFDHIVTQENKNRVVPFAKFYTVLSLYCTLDQLSIGRQLEVSSPLILRAGDDIYGTNLLHTILSEANGTNNSRSHLILSTRCGALVEVRQHELGSTNLVLSLYEY